MSGFMLKIFKSIIFFSFCFLSHASVDIQILQADFDVWKSEFNKLSDHLISLDPTIIRGSFPIPILYQQGVPAHDADSSLAIDYLFLPAYEKKKNLIIINSGIHGVEAAAGVFLQHYLLSYCTGDHSINRTNTAILIIHIMNPFGAKYGRRFNANNVDLNRNCFDASFSQLNGFPGLSMDNPEYEDIRDLVESTTNQFFIIWSGIREGIQESVWSFIQEGKRKISKALSGQYQYPKGIYYGGNSVEKECSSVQELMASHIDDFKNVVIIDVHTGLGKKGINQIMLNPLEEETLREAYQREMQILKTMFPDNECFELCEIQEADSHEFYTTGDFTQWIYERFPAKREEGIVLSFTSEIGTFPGRQVLEGIVNENYCYWNRDICGEEKYFDEREKLNILFNPDDEIWQKQIHRASEQMCKALSRFSLLNGHIN